MKHFLTVFFSLAVLMGLAQEGERGSIPKKTNTISEGVKHALVVGISEYHEASLRLNYAKNDAALFKDYLLLSENIPAENIAYLVDEDAVSINILRSLKKLLQNTQSGDVVYIYFAGHGDVVDDFGEKEGFLLAADANANQEYYAGGVVPLALLNNKVVGKMAANNVKVILILDACRSGFIFQEGTQKNMGTIQAMFENSTKILSCGPNELSYESSDISHGYFTYYLVKGLLGKADSNTDNNLQYRELDDYLYDNVSATVSKKHKQSQTPVLRTQNDRLVLKPVNIADNNIDIESFKNNINSSTAIASVRGVNSEKTPEVAGVIKSFNTAITKKNYYGKPTSALELYKNASKNSAFTDGLLFKMESELIKELSTSAQQLINKYISGSSVLPQGSEFSKQAKHLEICLELMGEDDFLYDRVYSSKLMLDAYAIIQSKNYSAYNVAKKKLKEALKVQSRAAYIHNALGMVYNYQQVYDSAHYHYKEAKELITTWATPIKNIGVNLLEQYQYDEAKEYLDSSLGMTGSNEDSFIKLGIINENQGKYKLAESYYKKALEINPKNTIALKKMSDIYELKGNLKNAAIWYNKAFELDSLKTIIETGLNAYIDNNNVDNKTAEQLFLNAIDLQPNTSVVYCEYADYLRTNKTNKNRLSYADSLYGLSIKKDPHNTWAYAGRGRLYYNMRNAKKAKQSFEEGIAKNPNKPLSYYYYAEYFKNVFKNNQYAEPFYLKAIKKDKYFIPAYSGLVEIYNEQKQYSKSITLLNNMIKTTPEAPDFWNLLGDTYYVKGAYLDAINAFKEAVKLDESYSKSYVNLGYSELHSNNFEAAKTYYHKALDSNPVKNKSSDIAAHIVSMAKNKNRFGTPQETKDLFKLAYDIDVSGNSGIPYSACLYINSEPNLAFKIAESTYKKVKGINLETNVLKLLVKCSIDNNDSVNADKYFKILSTVNKSPDLLLAGIYYIFKGDVNRGYALIDKTNPLILRSPKLKEMYSMETIQKYIFKN
ncbi:hypothetical protein BWZ22_07805 [Seonamhaeicola sp. S2-3]|uniref:tetratricopeptide repeat protein n=1 Tax=Seonamhaeicola sp. S2-3 TaxID=1936081 RepID=UPI000972E417|nr:tetratricopeptide repeat protein [Seonamhaeicola sp. S2-3]APY11152.1 hypothetical protein BWZ22_07805 [Seonamhaeicola sp. S2-3]